MDYTMIDVTSLKERVKVGDEACFYGVQDGIHLSADQVASSIGTISYELFVRVGRRVPRLLVDASKS